MVGNSDESELSSARIQLELARARGFSARLGSARGIFKSARVVEILRNELKVPFEIFKSCLKTIVIEFECSCCFNCWFTTSIFIVLLLRQKQLPFKS